MLFWTKTSTRFADAIADSPDSFCAFEILYLRCGLRAGEMLAPHARRHDFGSAVVSVTKSYQRIKGRDVTDPKTPKSVRTVAMPGFADEPAIGFSRASRGVRRARHVSVHYNTACTTR